MQDEFLEDLINQAKEREGGLILNLNEKPEVVVLTIEKYNQLLSQNDPALAIAEALISSLPDPETENQSKKILVTGGAGYIGAHLTRELVKAGYEVVVLDNLSCGKIENIPERVTFIEGDLADINFLRDVFSIHKFYAVMHMAASIEVEESVLNPEKYLENNVINTAKLLSVMKEANVNKIIFSSTAAVYGEQQKNPVPETAPLKPTNPYGYSKVLAEKIIKYYASYLGFEAVVLRYFNAAGASLEANIQPTHFSHLISRVLEVAKGQQNYIVVNGDDYQTADGTCERDFVHVLDIAAAHIKALETMDQRENFRVYNIGTGKALSVLEIINATTEFLNRMIPMEVGPRRSGDIQTLVADNKKIRQELGFVPQYSDIETIIKTSWG